MNLLSQGQIVQVRPVTQAANIPTEPTIWDSMFKLIPIILVIVVAVIVIIVFVGWFLNKRKERKDVYKADYYRTINLCKLQKSNRFLKPIFGVPTFLASKGHPIIVRYPNIKINVTKGENKKIDRFLELRPGESKIVGTYRGHCYTEDGCLNLLIAATNQKIFFLFAKLYVIKLRQGVKKRIIDPDDKSMEKTKTIDVLPDKFDLGDNFIIIDSFGLDLIGEYLYPVNVDEDGRIVDNRPFVYYDMMDIAMQKQVVDFGRNVVNAAEEYIRANPYVQWARKVEQENIRSSG